MLFRPFTTLVSLTCLFYSSRLFLQFVMLFLNWLVEEQEIKKSLNDHFSYWREYTNGDQ